MEEFEDRSLEEEDFLALLTHGKRVAGEQMIICVGVTESGYKKVLGFTQATTEHHEPIKERFRDLTKRGLSFEEGILCVIDGSRGMAAGGCARPSARSFQAEPKSSGANGINARTLSATCRRPTRKRGDPGSSGPTRSRPTRPQEPTYQAAKERLTGLHDKLEQINRKAGSLREGLEETLTLHRLGLFEELGRSLKTINSIENLNEKVEGYTDNVKRWHHSPQRHQWMALALLEAESRMRRLTGYKDLPKLKQALKEAIPDRE